MQNWNKISEVTMIVLFGSLLTRTSPMRMYNLYQQQWQTPFYYQLYVLHSSLAIKYRPACRPGSGAQPYVTNVHTLLASLRSRSRVLTNYDALYTLEAHAVFQCMSGQNLFHGAMALFLTLHLKSKFPYCS